MLLALSACDDSARADGSACASAFECSSGACLQQSPTSRVCARRCASTSACPSGQVCGRFDFRGRDDGGTPAGPLEDIVRVCRAPLNPRCSTGCAPAELCSGDDGVCVRACASAADCGGRRCVRDDCATGRCAAPCDDIADCPVGHSCNAAVTDTGGHGECIPIAPADVAPADASNCFDST